MIEHLRTMLTLIHNLKALDNNLTDEQQVIVVIRSLLKSLRQMKSMLTLNENIKFSTNISHHIELEAEHLGVQHATLIAHVKQ